MLQEKKFRVETSLVRGRLMGKGPSGCDSIDFYVLAVTLGSGFIELTLLCFLIYIRVLNLDATDILNWINLCRRGAVLCIIDV